MCEGLAADVDALLKSLPELKVQTLVDGAAEMRNLLAAAVNKSTMGRTVYELVDLGHLMQKLAPAADVVFGEAGREVLARWKLKLLNGAGALRQVDRQPALARDLLCRMRGSKSGQDSMLALVTLNELVPARHPVRTIRRLAGGDRTH